jgi:glutathione S-transferase
MKQQGTNMMNFYSAWFCPYAQRAWLTLEHHKVPFNYVESLTVKENQEDGDHGYQKNPRLLELNPKGLVPTLEFPPQYNLPSNVQHEKLKKVGTSLVLSESIDCIEFLNTLAMSNSATSSDTIDNGHCDLIPDPSLVSTAHEFNQSICSTFYKVLMKPTREEQKEAFDSFLLGIEKFLKDVKDDGFYKSAYPTIVDFTVIPWILRLPLLQYYRPMFDMHDIFSKETSDQFNAYTKRIKELHAVQNTLWESEEALIAVYKRYADGTATSQVGQAVRSGKNAHDI